MSTLLQPKLQKNRVLEQVILAIFLGFSGFIAIIFIYLLGFQLFYLQRILPGVTISSIPVHGMTVQEAVEFLSGQFTYPTDGQVAFQFEGSSWQVSPGELGFLLDPEKTAQEAFLVGRGDDLLERAIFATGLGKIDLQPRFIFNQQQAYDFITQISHEIDQAAIEPSISILDTEVVINPGQRGRSVDVARTMDILAYQLSNLENLIVPLIVNSKDPAILDVSDQAAEARRILSQPLTLKLPEGEGGAGPWIIEPPDLARILTFEKIEKDGQLVYQLNIHRRLLQEKLSQLAPEVSRSPQNARFIYNDDTHNLDPLTSATVGRSLDIGSSTESIPAKLFSGEHTIPLDLIITPPPVLDDATSGQLGITGLIHTETSYFYGSNTSRVQNIQAAASQFHGLLVPPGATFSMAQELGDISLDNGYAEALIIMGGRTIQGIGGGVCQVSTTLFRTAFFAGLPIVERNAHAYRVSYYEKISGNRTNPSLAGLDAAVFVPLVDLKFINDTSQWLLMETYVSPSNSSITWKFYGYQDGRSVEWNSSGLKNIVEAPKKLYRENPELSSGEVKQVDWEADGADVSIQRIVSRAGNVILQDSFHTHYQPWQAIYEYGPGTPDMPPPDEEDTSSDG